MWICLLLWQFYRADWQKRNKKQLPIKEFIMQVNTFKPLPELKTLWYLIDIICFILLLLPIVLMFIMQVELVLSAICLVAWLLLFFSILIYIPAFYNTLEYGIDNDAVRLKKGVFWRRKTSVPYGKITNIDITQGPVERLFKISQLTCPNSRFQWNSQR